MTGESPGVLLTAAELGEELTLYARAGGSRKRLLCHRDVADALMALTPPESPSWSPSSLVITPDAAMTALMGIDIVISDEDGPGEWRIVHAHPPFPMVIYGRLRDP